MSYDEIIAELRQRSDERGIRVWERTKPEGSALTTFGIGITKLKDFAKKMPKNHELAAQLWASDILDAMLVAGYIEEPKKVTKEQVAQQILQCTMWTLSDSYCSSVVVPSAFAPEFIEKWKNSPVELVRRSAYVLVAGIAKTSKDMPDEFFLKYLEDIKQLQSAPNYVKDGMNNALFYIGHRNATLHEACLKIAKQVGKVQVDYGDNSCEAIDVVKHLGNEKLKQRLAAK